MRIFLTALALNWIVSVPLAAQKPVQLTANERALMEAAFAGQLEVVKRLVDDGTGVDVVDPEYRTPLMFASFNGHTEVGAFLRDHGAEINMKDINGRTALMYASSGPFGGTVRFLLDEGADADIQGSLEGFTSLMTAAAEGQLEVVRLLIDRGADTTLEDKDGDTALSFARRIGHTAVVELLEKPPKRD